jgi:hypothetical protein
MTTRSIATVVALAGLATVAAAQTAPRALFSNVASAGNNAVPGRTGVFNAGATSSSSFDRPFLSPDGTKILFLALEEATAPSTDDLEIVFSGTLSPTLNVTARLVEDEATFFDSTITWSSFRTRAGINHAGDFAVGTDTTAATTADDVVVKYTASTNTFSVVAREGQASPLAGQNFGLINDSVHILNDGSVRIRSALNPSTTKQVLFDLNAGTVLSETDVTTPTGQLVAPDQTIDVLSSDRFQSSADGSVWIAHGDLNGPTGTDLFIVRNNVVLAQEGAALPGESGFPTVALLSGDTGSQQISPNGQHIAFRGNYSDGTGATATDFVRVNGDTVARTDEAIFTGATELFDDAPFSTTFFMNVVNDNGDYVVGGTTNASNLEANAVLVLNSERVVVRENDPVDLNGDGQLNDDAFIDTFGNDDAALTADLKLYFVASVRNGAGTAFGQALLVIDLDAAPPVCRPDLNSDGELTFDDIQLFVSLYNANDPRADFNNDQEWTFDDIQLFVQLYNAGC